MQGYKLLGAVAVAAFVGFATAAASQTAPPEFRDYQQASRARGLAAIIPASTAFASGYIYRYDRNIDGLSFIRRVCTQAFITPPEVEDVTFPATHRLREGNFNIGFKLMPAVLASKVSAAFGFSTGSVRTLDVTLNGVKSYQIAAANDFDAKTRKVVQRVMNPACLINLQREPLRNGKFINPLFLVYKASTASGFEYSFNRDGKTNLNVSATLDTLGSAETGFNIHRVDAVTFRADRIAGLPKLYIAADIIRSESASALGQVAATPRGDLAVRPASSADFDALGAITFTP